MMSIPELSLAGCKNYARIKHEIIFGLSLVKSAKLTKDLLTPPNDLYIEAPLRYASINLISCGFGNDDYENFDLTHLGHNLPLNLIFAPPKIFH